MKHSTLHVHSRVHTLRKLSFMVVVVRFCRLGDTGSSIAT